MSRGKLGGRGRYRQPSKCSPGGSHVPCPARPRCQQHRRSRHVLQQAVRYRAAKRRPGYANFAIDEPPLKLVLWRTPAMAVRSTTSALRSPTPRIPSMPSRPAWLRRAWPRPMSVTPPAATPGRTSSGCRARRMGGPGRSTRSWPTARSSTVKSPPVPPAAAVAPARPGEPAISREVLLSSLPRCACLAAPGPASGHGARVKVHGHGGSPPPGRAVPAATAAALFLARPGPPPGGGTLRAGGESGAECVPVPGAPASRPRCRPARVGDPGLALDPQVMADGGLGQVERSGQVTDAHLAALMRADQRHQAQPDWIAQGLEQLGQPGRPQSR